MSLWALRVVLPAPDRTYPNVVGASMKGVADGDQSLMIWATSRNARILVTHPTRLLDFEQHHPLARAAGLGHPLYADGIMAIPFWLLGLDPIPLLNVASVLMIWLSALTMFFLARYWTGNDAAAFTAGLAFGFQPVRILGAHWPGIFGNQWSPVALLFAHRLLARGGWRDAVALAGLTGLLVLGSIYQLIPFVVMAIPYATWAAVRHRDRVVRLMPKLFLVAAVGVVSAVVQCSAYLHLKDVWGLGGRASLLPPASQFLPGASSSPGLAVLVLAVIGLVDRLRGPRTDPTGDDPRLVHLLMGFLALWVVVAGFPVPWSGSFVPSLLEILGRIVPNVDAVSIVSSGCMAVYLPTALLAAYGVVSLTGRGGRPLAVTVSALVVACLLAEVFVPPIARRSFGQDVALEAQPLPPPSPELRALYRSTLEGPVLDLPPCLALGFACRAHHLLMAAYHEHPIASGWGSHLSPLMPMIERLGGQLPDPAAADALYALGFRSVVLHGELLGGAHHPLTDLVPSLQARVVPVGQTDQHQVYRLRSPVPITTDFAALAPAPSAREQTMSPPGADIVFHLRNATSTTFRHPDPIEPTRLVVVWQGLPSGHVVEQQRVRALLPVALAAGAREALTIPLHPPAADGVFSATLAVEQDPTAALAIERVRVARE